MKSFEELEQEIYAYVASTGIFVKGDQKLGRMRKLMDFLGNPQEKIKVMHIAGTSGKTSTSYYTAALLHAAGKKVGLTVSPHVVDVRERAQIGMKVLEKDVWAEKMGEYFELVKGGGQKPSYMEFFMGFAFWLAEKESVDYMVVEVGLGGLYDATNVVLRADKVSLLY